MKTIKEIQLKFFIFTGMKNCCILQGGGGCFCNVKNEHKFQKDIACSCHYNHNRSLLKSKNDKFHTRGIDCGKLVSGSLKRSEVRRNFILCSSSCRSMYSMGDYRSPFWVYSKSPSTNYNTNPRKKKKSQFTIPIFFKECNRTHRYYFLWP